MAKAPSRKQRNIRHQEALKQEAEIKRGLGTDSKSKRLARRAALRALTSLSKDPFPRPPRPAPILVLFFLDRIKTKVDHKLNTVFDESGNISFSSVPVVMIRDLRTKRVKGPKGRMIEEDHLTQWRVFAGAMPVREQDDVSETSQFIGIQAPMTAWAAAGLLDGMVLRDLPREERAKPYDYKRAA